jgi:hypothetical protein
MPRLSDAQVRNASERRDLRESAEEALRRQYVDVSRATGVPAQAVAEVVELWLERHHVAVVEEPTKGPPKPTLDTELIREGKIKTIALHLVAIEALFRLLDPETASRASAALQTTREALTRWREVQKGDTDDAEVP